MTSYNDMNDHLKKCQEILEDNHNIVKNHQAIADGISSFKSINKIHTRYKYAKDKYGDQGKQVAVALGKIKDMEDDINYIKPQVELCDRIIENKLTQEEHEIINTFCLKNKNLSYHELLDLSHKIKNHNLIGLHTINPRTLWNAYYILSMKFIAKEIMS